MNVPVHFFFPLSPGMRPPPFLFFFSRAYPIHQVSLFQIGTLLSLSPRGRRERENGAAAERVGCARRVSFRAIKELSQRSGKPTVFAV